MSIFILYLKVEEKFTQNLFHNELEGNYSKYIKGKKVAPIFSKKFKQKVKNNDINDLDVDQLSLFYLINEISKLDGFDEKKAIELVTPYKIMGLRSRWGIFSTLNIKGAMKELKNSRDHLNSQQLNSVIEYVNGDKILENINNLIRQKTNLIHGCKNNVKKFLVNELKKDNIDIKFSKNEQLRFNLSNYSAKELSIIKDIFEWIPDNICIVLNTIFDIENYQEINKKTLDQCQEKVKGYVDKYLETKGIKLNNSFKDYTLTELLIIKDVYRFIINCDNLKESDPNKMYNKNKENYILNLIKNINLNKNLLPQIKGCPIKVKEYLNEKYLERNIPLKNLQDFPKDEINNLSANTLEYINELYINLPKCSDFKKRIIKDKIEEIINYMELISGNSYGCDQDINLYLRNQFSTNNIKNILVGDISSKLDKMSLEDLEKIFKIYKNIPPCKDLDMGNKSDYEKKSEAYFSLLEDRNKPPKRILNKSHDISKKPKKDYHPFLGGHEKLKDDEFFSTKEIFKEAEINFDKYMYHDLFKIPSCKAKSILENQCETPKKNKNNDNMENIIQSETSGISSIYAPKLYINIPKNKGYKVSLK